MKKLFFIILIMLVAVQVVSAENVYQLGNSGNGMYVRTAISGDQPSFFTNNTTSSVSTHDIIYLQFQDIGLMFLYMFLGVVFLALFLWSIVMFKDELQARDDDEESGL